MQKVLKVLIRDIKLTLLNNKSKKVSLDKKNLLI